MDLELLELDSITFPEEDLSIDSANCNSNERAPPDETCRQFTISHLRDFLGMAFMNVVHTSEPVIVTRYGKAEVALVPLWEWRWLKRIEAAIQNGEIDAADFLAELNETPPNEKEDS